MAVILTLSLGIGANTTMFGVLNGLFFRTPVDVADPGRVVRVYVTQQAASIGEYTGPVATFPKYALLRDHVRGFANLAAYAPEEISLGRGANAREVTVDLVTASWFPTLGAHPAVGRFFTADEEKRKERLIVLGFEAWRGQFGGDPAIVGKTVPIGAGSYTVVGVARRGFMGVDLTPVSGWLPLETGAAEFGSPLNCGGCYWLATVGRLQSSRSTDQVAAEATAVFRDVGGGDADSTAKVSLGPIQEARGPARSSNSSLSLWLAAVSALVLLIACANVASLLLARAIGRQRDTAIRLSLGATHVQLMRESLIEGVLLAMAGGVGALALAVFVGPHVARALLPQGASADNLLDPRVLFFTGSVAVFTGLASTLVPAVRIGRTDLNAVIKASSVAGRPAGLMSRQVLVVFQIALTLVLVEGAGLFLSSLRAVLANPLGFDADHLVSVSVDLKAAGYQTPAINTAYEKMRDRVSALGGVRSASISIGSPFATSLAGPLDVPGVDDSVFRGPGGVPYVQMVSPEYFKTLGSVVRKGRDFAETDVLDAPRVALVNQTMAARLWPGSNPLGHCLRVGRGDNVPCSEIVGVVQDVKRNGLTETATMEYYIPFSQRDSAFAIPVTSLLVRTKESAAAMTDALRRAIQEASPDLPYVDVRPMAQLFEWQLRPWRLGSTVFVVFGVIATLLAVVGLYSLLSYLVAQRTREVGIRMALGASRASVLWAIIGRGGRLAVIGIVIGAIAGLLCSHLIASLLYGVAPTDGVVLGVASLLLLVVAVGASYGPASRATRIDPSIALRAE